MQCSSQRRITGVSAASYCEQAVLKFRGSSQTTFQQQDALEWFSVNNLESRNEASYTFFMYMTPNRLIIVKLGLKFGIKF